VYLISGDEPLQHGEAADNIRRAARLRDFSEREVLEAGTGFDWGALGACAAALSLFAGRRLIELRLTSAKPGSEGSRALEQFCARPGRDNLLLILCPRLERAQQKTKWLQAIDRVGVVVQIWPVEAPQLPSWIDRRLRDRGLLPEPDVAHMLAQRVEGNLLAAAQEIEKLLLLHGPGPLSARELAGSVADSSRFDVFDLVDAGINGDGSRALRILAGLRAEGTAPAVTLWALAREIRQLAIMARAVEQGASPEQAMSAGKIWEKRKPLVRRGLQRLRSAEWRRLLCRCEHADRATKGRSAIDPWSIFEEITAAMAGRGGKNSG
jgi:DNA polymerase-3 subunit delta